MKESNELHHSIGSMIDGAHPGTKYIIYCNVETCSIYNYMKGACLNECTMYACMELYTWMGLHASALVNTQRYSFH